MVRTVLSERPGRRLIRSRQSIIIGVLLVVGGTFAACGTSSKSPPQASPSFVTDPASLVNTFAGTGTGGVSPGSISEFPGADVPFGMVQWSPDTSPDRIAGSGYSWNDSHISGFSLTHLSGPGCAAYGDIPILPTKGVVEGDPTSATDSFSHSKEHASPGRYSVTLDNGIDVDLSVTTRTGLSQFTFPESEPANLLFKVSDSANGVTSSDVNVVGNDMVTGEATSGDFCQTGSPYTIYFAARFNRPFSSSGTWSGKSVTDNSDHCAGSKCGGFVTFETTSNPVVLMKVGISFVSLAGAEGNLASEDPGWSLKQVEAEAANQWNKMLGKIRIGGGTHTEQRIFYTALYHSLLHPNVVSDADGEYIGDDGRVHTSPQPQYSNFSEWDIYRSEIPLLSVVAPAQTGDMIESLVNDAQQNGWLPKWATVGGDGNQMNGDSADAIIADAYAFGVRNFDAQAALAAMVKGATEEETGHGLEIERQYLTEYESQHYVDAGSLDLTSINYSDGGSVTLEYALDDFSIAQLAQALGDNSVYESMMKRAHNWEYLLDPSTGYIEGRNSDGSFPEGPAFQKDLFEPGGEEGFEEGNAIQYTWSVPQDLYALGNLLGGDSSAVEKLDTFFTHLNAGRYEPYDWAGNEPNLWTPWEFDYFSAPYKTQQVVREIVDTEYHDAPVNEPGNDDLGAMSSWYVWAAIGLYPVTPGTADLALASPLFPVVSIQLPDGKALSMKAAGASADSPYIHSLTVKPPGGAIGISVPASTCATNSTPSTSATSVSWQKPWIPSTLLSSGGELDYTLSRSPDQTWGTGQQNAPPSYGTGRITEVGFSVPSGGTTVKAGSSTSVDLGVEQISDASPGATWTATATAGLSVEPVSGSFKAGSASGQSSGPATCGGPQRLVQSVHVTAAGSIGHGRVMFELRTTTGTELPAVVMNITTESVG